jgi:serine/threonine protein phosphatase 1
MCKIDHWYGRFKKVVGMSRYFITSDVHGFFNELMVALNSKGFDVNNSDHKLIILGDLFDRGPDNRKVYEFVKSLGDRFIYVRGNHEDLLGECVREIVSGREVSEHHWHNRTVDTIAEFTQMNTNVFRGFVRWENINQTTREVMKPILDWIDEKSVDCYELDDNVFVHGWIPSTFRKNWTKENWQRARWYNGMEMWKNGYCLEDTIIWCGHWCCSYGWSRIRQKYKEFPPKNRKEWERSFQPFVDDGIIALDSCVSYSGFLNCVVYDEEDKTVIL